jgi:thiol-disulfide isomerase/thioredoxin
MLEEMRCWLTLFAASLNWGCSSGMQASNSCDAGAYPCGPYGYAMGAVIADLAITGQHDTNGNGRATDDPVVTLQLAGYFHDPGYRALTIVISSESCVPCQNEQPDLVALEQHYNGQVALLEAIVQNASGQPADQGVIDNWVARFNVPFDMTPDPTQALAPYYTSSFPTTMAIRLADMRITYRAVGPSDGLMLALDQIVAP